jgi:CRISPR-associated protein Cas1
MPSLRTLPKARDRISFLYFEHCRIEQEGKAIAVFKEKSKFFVPCAAISTLLLGPGTSITHAAIKTLADNVCEVQWVGEDVMRFYAHGRSGANNARRLTHQATLWADPIQRLAVVTAHVPVSVRRAAGREPDPAANPRPRRECGSEPSTSNGVRELGLEWHGRDYRTRELGCCRPDQSRPLHCQHLSYTAVCQAALHSVGYSPSPWVHPHGQAALLRL